MYGIQSHVYWSNCARTALSLKKDVKPTLMCTLILFNVRSWGNVRCYIQNVHDSAFTIISKATLTKHIHTYGGFATTNINLLQTAIDAFYDTSGGHGEDVHESVPVEETRPPSPGPAIAGTIHPLASSKPTAKV